MRKTITSFAFALLGFFTCSAYAAEQGLYLGGGVGAYTLDLDDFSFDDNAAVAKVMLGYRFSDHLAFEVDYQKLFEVEDNLLGVPAEIDVDAWTVSLRPILPVSDFVDLYAKVGYSWYDAEVRTAIPGFSITESETGRIGRNDTVLAIQRTFPAIQPAFSTTAHYRRQQIA